MEEGSNVKTSLISICGDNLGSQCIGGFTLNFSSSKNFCRYRLIDRVTFAKSPMVFGPKKPLGIGKSVQQLTCVNGIVDGIKFNSSFNSAKSFHVCSGLLPCLGHNHFERVVANYLALYTEYLEKAENISPMIR